jgi:uncharacterized protein (TIGR02246 family)
VDSLGVLVATPARYQPHIVPPMAAETPESLAQALAAAINARDIDAAIELWTDDATIVQADGQAIHGRAAVAGALQALIDNGVSVEIELANVFAADGVALAAGTLTLSGNGAGEASFAQSTSSAVVYTRQPDGWRIAIDAPWGLPQA